MTNKESARPDLRRFGRSRRSVGGTRNSGTARRGLTWRIDTTGEERGMVTVVDADGAHVAQRSFLLVAQAPGALLRCITALRRPIRASIRDAAAIEVVPGPGRFSRVRLGVVTANALAWAFGTQLSVRGHRVRIAIPEYGAEPHIGGVDNDRTE